jgi:hypothetical protein
VARAASTIAPIRASRSTANLSRERCRCPITSVRILPQVAEAGNTALAGCARPHGRRRQNVTRTPRRPWNGAW